MADLARLPQPVHRLERFLDRHRAVRPVQVVQVEIIGLQPPQAVVDRAQDGGPRKPGLVRARAHLRRNLAGQNDAVAPPLQRLAQDDFRGALVVQVRRIEEVHPALQAAVDHGERRGLVRLPAKGHRAETHARDSQVGFAQDASLHMGSADSVARSRLQMVWATHRGSRRSRG